MRQLRGTYEPEQVASFSGPDWVKNPDFLRMIQAAFQGILRLLNNLSSEFFISRQD